MLKHLIGIRLRRLLSSLYGGRGGVAAGVIYAIIGIIFVGYSFMIGFGLGSMLIPSGLEYIYFSLFVLITSLVVFMFSIMETKTALFECMDNELLMSMPIRPIDILVSRCAAVLIANLVEVALITVPATIAYLFLGGSPLYAIGFVLVTLFAVLFVTVLSALFGYLVALIASRSKHKNLVTIITSLAFLALYFAFYFSLMGDSMNSTDDPQQLVAGLVKMLSVFSPIGEACMLSPLPLILIALVSVGSAIIFALLMSKFYFRIINESKSTISSPKKEVRATSGTALTALAKKELGRLFSSAGYLLNGGVGVIFQVLMGIMLFTNGEQIMPVAEEFSALLGIDKSYLLGLLSVAICSALPLTNSVSASALSLEGRNFWVLQSLPVDPMTVLYAKLVPHIVLSLPSTLALSILLGIAFSIPAIFWPFIIITPIISVLIGALLGLILNVKFPKFEYTNEHEVVKQSLPVFVMVMLGLLCTMICVGASVFIASMIGPLVALLALLVLLLLTLSLLIWLLNTVACRGLQKLLLGR